MHEILVSFLHNIVYTRCPFHKYTASACGLASFPRKRESRGRAPWGLDARLRGHDILLAQDLRNGHLAEGLCTLSARMKLPHPLELPTLIEAIIGHQTHMSSKNAIFPHGRSWCRAG